VSGGPDDAAGADEGRVRLFVALMLDADACEGLAAWARAVFGGEDGVRLLGADALHLTLCFLGAVSVGAVDPIAAALTDVVGQVGAQPLVFSPEAVRRLPPRRPRVCAVALHDRDGRAGALQAALAQRLSDGGWYVPESRRWLAHVTVARVGRGGRVGSGRSAGSAGSPAPPALDSCAATAVALMRSWPGSRYEPLRRIALG
jgi:2'-5' RNA ligase